MTMQPLELAGQTFGQLKVIERAARPDRPFGHTLSVSSWWSCQCHCGAVVVKNGPELNAGRVTSCGQHARAANRGVWDDDTVQALRTLWAEGHSSNEIGRRLGFSRNAIIGKKNRIGGAAPRPSPIRRGASSAQAIPSVPRVTVTLPPLASETRLDVRSVLSVVPSRPTIVPQKPLPVSLVPLPPPAPIRRGNCQFPLWSHTERPKFGADGNPLVCSAPAAHGPYCPTHRAICYTKTQRMANAA